MQAISAAGGDDIAFADLGDRDAIAAAAEGCDAIYYIAPNMSEDERRNGDAMILAAHEAGVDRFIFHSVLHTHVQGLPHHWERLFVEEAITESALRYTILQVSSYMQNMLPGWDRMLETGVHAMAYDVDVPMSLVDLDDVAEAAVNVLADDGSVFGVFEIAGPIITLNEKADILSRVTGQDIRADKAPQEAALDHAKHAGASDFTLKTMAQMFSHYDIHGLVGSARTLEWILGRPPTDFETFASRVQAARSA